MEAVKRSKKLLGGTKNENLMDSDGVGLSENYENYPIYETITESADITQELEQGVLHVFKKKLSIVVLHDHLDHIKVENRTYIL